MSKAKRRLDVALVEDGLAPSREKAQALILAGRALVDGARRDKAGFSVPEGARVELAPGERLFASRGGLKLDGALDRLGLDPAGLRCLDVGASTGGFTDVLLRRGAVHVTAVDVGKGLIDPRLAADPRVFVVEELNARDMRPEDVRPPYDLATIDVSFISLVHIVPRVVALLPAGRVLAMVKPQFEVGRREASRGKGVIRDPELRAAAVEKIARAFVELGWGIEDAAASPVAGPKGNREVFLLAAPGPRLEESEWRVRIVAEVGRDGD